MDNKENKVTKWINAHEKEIGVGLVALGVLASFVAGHSIGVASSDRKLLKEIEEAFNDGSIHAWSTVFAYDPDLCVDILGDLVPEDKVSDYANVLDKYSSSSEFIDYFNRMCLNAKQSK